MLSEMASPGPSSSAASTFASNPQPLYPPAQPSRYLAPSHPSYIPGLPAASLLRRTSSRSSSQSYLEASDDEESNAERGRSTSVIYRLNPSISRARSDLPMNWRELRKRTRRFEKSAKDWFEGNAGLCLIALAQFFFASMNASVKYLNSIGGNLSTLELVGIRMAFTLAGCVSWLFYTGDPNPLLGPKDVRSLLVVRGFIGFFGLTGMYQSLRHLSLSDATVLGFLAPTATAILGYFVLKEPFSRKESLAGLISLFGVILIARPTALFGLTDTSDPSNALPSDYSLSRVQTSKMADPVEAVEAGQRLAAVGFALMGVCGSAGAYISIRAIGKRAKPFHSITYFSFWCVVVSIVGMIVLRQPVELPYGLIGWLSIMVIGVFGLAAQVLLTMGLQREKAGRASLAMYTQLLFAGVIERVCFHTVPPLLSLFGTFIILTAAIWVAFSKQDASATTATSEPSSTSGSIGGRGWNAFRSGGVNGTPKIEAGDYMPLTEVPEEIDSQGVGAIPKPRTLAGRPNIGEPVQPGAEVPQDIGRNMPQRKASGVSVRSNRSGYVLIPEEKQKQREAQ